jgi:hypothetical protein
MWRWWQCDGQQRRDYGLDLDDDHHVVFHVDVLRRRHGRRIDGGDVHEPAGERVADGDRPRGEPEPDGHREELVRDHGQRRRAGRLQSRRRGRVPHGVPISVTSAIESLPTFQVDPTTSKFRMVRIDGQHGSWNWMVDPTNAKAACATLNMNANRI